MPGPKATPPQKNTNCTPSKWGKDVPRRAVNAKLEKPGLGLVPGGFCQQLMLPFLPWSSKWKIWRGWFSTSWEKGYTNVWISRFVRQPHHQAKKASFWCCGLTRSTKLVQCHWVQEAICGWNYLGPVDAQLSLRRSLTFGRKGQVWRTCMHAQREGERERERKWMWEENFRKSSIEQHAVQKLVTCVFKRGRGKGIESSISLLILTFYLHYLHCLPNQITFRVVKTMWSRRNTVPLWCHFGDKNKTSHQVRKAFRSTTLRQTGDKAWRTCAELHRISSKHSVFSCWKPFQTLPTLVFDLVISDQCVFVCSCVFI